jgi:hypothetical protein
MPKFEFIINAIIDITQEKRIEALMDDVVSIRGIRNGNIISIKRSQNNPKLEALVTAEVDGKSETEDILKVILYDILKQTDMLDHKLNMKLDIIFNEKKISHKQETVIIK